MALELGTPSDCPMALQMAPLMAILTVSPKVPALEILTVSPTARLTARLKA
jgi:hypothetical protein